MPIVNSGNSLEKRFGVTDGLYKGGAIAYNLLLHALIMNTPVLGADRFITITFLTLSMMAILEIPSGLVADHFSRLSAIKISFFARFSSILFFSFGVFTAINSGNPWPYFIVCSFVDAIANSFLSGSFEGAYLRLAEIKNIDFHKNFYLRSYRYGWFFRIFLPIVSGICVVLSREFVSDEKHRIVFLLVGIALIQSIMSARVLYDLSDLKNTKRIKNTYEFKPIFSQARTFIPMIVLGLGWFVYISATVVLINMVYVYLKRAGFASDQVWYLGIATGISMHVMLFFISTFLYPKLSRIENTKKSRSVLLLAGMLIACISFVTLSATSQTNPVQLIVIVISVFSLGLISQGIIYEMNGSFVETVKERYYSTWLSGGKLIGLLIYGVSASVVVFTKLIDDKSIYTLAGCGLAFTAAFIFNHYFIEDKKKDQISLKWILSGIFCISFVSATLLSLIILAIFPKIQNYNFAIVSTVVMLIAFCISGYSVISVLTNETKRVALEEDLNFKSKELTELSNILKDRFKKKTLDSFKKTMSIIRHEIKSPFSQVHIFLNNYKHIDIASLDNYTTQILLSVSRAERLVNTLTLDKKYLTEKTNVWKLQEIVDEAINEVSTIKIHFEYEVKVERDITIYSNKDMLLSVLINLICNAIEASNYFLLRASVLDNIVKIAIENPYFGSKLENDIFNLFVTTKKNGSGIGLSICSNLLEEAGSKLEFRQEHGKVNFDFHLPLART